MRRQRRRQSESRESHSGVRRISPRLDGQRVVERHLAAGGEIEPAAVLELMDADVRMREADEHVGRGITDAEHVRRLHEDMSDHGASPCQGISSRL